LLCWVGKKPLLVNTNRIKKIRKTQKVEIGTRRAVALPTKNFCKKTSYQTYEDGREVETERVGRARTVTCLTKS